MASTVGKRLSNLETRFEHLQESLIETNNRLELMRHKLEEVKRSVPSAYPLLFQWRCEECGQTNDTPVIILMHLPLICSGCGMHAREDYRKLMKTRVPLEHLGEKL